jgi:Uma2 family endonuclease
MFQIIPTILKATLSPLIKVMTASPPKILTIEDFLKLSYIEESPAWEYVDGVTIQKPMPKTQHSILQKRLLTEVDSHSETKTWLPVGVDG